MKTIKIKLDRYIKKLKIITLADLHIGDKNCDLELVKSLIKKIQQKDYSVKKQQVVGYLNVHTDKVMNTLVKTVKNIGDLLLKLLFKTMTSITSLQNLTLLKVVIQSVTDV